MAQDFRLLVGFPRAHEYTILEPFQIFSKFTEIFAEPGAPPCQRHWWQMEKKSFLTPLGSRVTI